MSIELSINDNTEEFLSALGKVTDKALEEIGLVAVLGLVGLDQQVQHFAFGTNILSGLQRIREAQQRFAVGPVSAHAHGAKLGISVLH